MELANLIKPKINEIIQNGIKLNYNTIEFKYYRHKYSSYNGEDTINLFLDGCYVSKKGVRINYNCPMCDHSNTIVLKKLLLKQNLNCKWCKGVKNDLTINKIDIKKLSLEELIIYSNNEFNNTDNKYKEYFYKKHLTEIEFNNLKDKIYAIDGNIITDRLEFYEHIKIVSHHQYSQKVLHNGKLFTFRKVEFKCDLCDSIFSTSRNYKEKSYNQILCRRCHLNNKVFNIKFYKNINNETLTYQSKIELDFIKFCNLNNIVIKDGNVINYEYKDKTLKYYIDFLLPEKNMLVEIKDDHCWHKEQVSNGKWEAKLEGIKNFQKNNSLAYHLVFKKSFNDFISKLILL